MNLLVIHVRERQRFRGANAGQQRDWSSGRNRPFLLVLAEASTDRREDLVGEMEVGLRIGSIAVDRLVHFLNRRIFLRSAIGGEEGVAKAHGGRRRDLAELRVHVQVLALLVLLVEVVEAGDQVEAAVKPLLGRRDELQFVVLALRIEGAGPRQDRRRREEHVTVELLILPIAIVVDEANRRTAADIP